MENSTFSLGLSLQYISGCTNMDLSSLPGSFDTLELNGSCFDSAAFMKKNNHNHFQHFNLTDYLSTSLTHSIAEQPQGFINEFIKQFETLAVKARQANIQSVTLDLSFDTAFGHKDKTTKRINLLKKLSPILNSNNLTLLLPVRLPYQAEDIPAYYLNVLTTVMSPDIALLLDIHPHELGKLFSPATLLRWIKFDLAIIRFIYEYELGNHLVAGLLAPWHDYLKQIMFDGCIYFAPHCSNQESLIAECHNILTLLQQVAGSEK